MIYQRTKKLSLILLILFLLTLFHSRRISFSLQVMGVQAPWREGGSVALYRRNFSLMEESLRKGELGKALFILDQMEKPLSHIHDYLSLYRLKALKGLGKYQEALSLLDGLISQAESPVLPLLMLEKGYITYELAKYQEALWAFKEACLKLEGKLQREACFFLGLTYERLKEWEDAYRTFCSLRGKFPMDLYVIEAEKRIFWLWENHPETERDMARRKYLPAKWSYEEGKYEEAVRIYLNFLRQYINSPLAIEALFDLAETAKRLRQWSLAKAALKRVLIRGRKQERLKAFYFLAKIHWNLNENAIALSYLKEILKDSPMHSLYKDSLYMMGRIAQEEGRYSNASNILLKLVQEFPKDSKAWEWLWYAGWVNYRKGDFETSYQLFKKGYEEFPEQGARFLYWTADCLNKLKNTQESQILLKKLLEEHRDSYYAFLAIEMGKKGKLSLDPFKQSSLVKVQSLNIWEIIGRQEENPRFHYHMRRIQTLLSLDLVNYASMEVDFIAQGLSKLKEFQGFIAYLYQTVGQYGKSFRFINRFEKEIFKDSQENIYFLKYPLPFWDLVRTYSGQRKLNSLLVISLIRQESAFNPAAQSIAGARGLMQLIPGTATKAIKALNLPNFTLRQLNEAKLNISLGTWYLEKLFHEFDGSVVKILSAYNAGEKAVREWSAKFHGQRDDVFVENIPYAETRDYVKRVIGNWYNYQRIYTLKSQ